jgi:hypothetical protein
MASKPKKTDPDGSFLKTVRDRYEAGYNKERKNIAEAYDDLAFRAGDQWPADVKRQRLEAGSRPCLTVNLLPQFIRQVTGDIRQMRPAMQVLPIDDEADEEIAEDIGGLIRYIENQGDAQAAYYNAADAQVTCGIGAWRIDREYMSPRTFNQEIRVRPIEDPVSIIWDPNAVDPTREDAMWCIVPIDMSWETFKEQYPDAVITDFTSADIGRIAPSEGWYSSEIVRVAEYWFKKSEKTQLALSPDGSVIDLEDADEETLMRIQQEGWRVEARAVNRVYRAVVSGAEILEPETKQCGRYIPIVPLIGEEVKIGREVVRHGVVRFAKDPQRIFNYFHSAEVEAAALQPKAPWLGTEKQFENHIEIWETANTENHAYLPYTPDPTAPGAPQRIAPPVASSAISNSIERSAHNMKAVVGIYDAQLGARSNETSGVAIRARQSEGDTGTYVYKDNFARSLRHTARIIIDLIPEVYDTARTIRILGEDGKQRALKVNQPVQIPMMMGEMQEHQAQVQKDLTRGSYDVTITMGPSYSTKSQEALDGMKAFMQAAPQVAPLFIDLFAKANEWPMAREIAERLETTLPPEIKARMEARKQGVDEDQIDAFLEQQKANQPPDPAQQMQMAGMQAELATKQALAQKAEADAAKAVAEAQRAGMEMQQQQASPNSETAEPGEPMTAQQPRSVTGLGPQIAIIDPRVNDLAAQIQQQQMIIEELSSVIREIAPTVMEGMHGPDGTREPTQKETLMQMISQLGDALAGMQAAQLVPKTVSLARDDRGQITGGTVAPVSPGSIN